ncbi:MAG: FAD-dependent oxidoreductase [Bacteroidota bacterium]
MTRAEFIKICGVLGIGLPLQSTLVSCNPAALGPDGRVVIVGAGAAGLATAYLLRLQGIEVTVLEASTQVGGRMKRTTEFAEFPIPLGAEWIHTDPSILSELVNDPTNVVNIATTDYDPATDYGLFEGERISLAEAGFDGDHKFINSSWLDFFEEYILPDVQDRIQFNAVVEAIDYSEDIIRVRTSTEEFTADRVVVTIPLKMLQSGSIQFTPALPNSKQRAIDDATVWSGCKAFIEFSESFYPAFTGFNISPETAGQKLYYDAAYGQNTTQNVLGLFAVGTGADPYLALNDQALISFMLDELDALYDGQASQYYLKHTFQNWTAEPYIGGAYLYDHESFGRVRTLGDSVDNKVFFAGEAYTDGSNWGGVDAAIGAAQRVVSTLVG